MEPHDTAGSTRVNYVTSDGRVSPQRDEFPSEASNHRYFESQEVLQHRGSQFPTVSGPVPQYPQELSLHVSHSPLTNASFCEVWDRVSCPPHNRVMPWEFPRCIWATEPFDPLDSLIRQGNDRTMSEALGRCGRRHREGRPVSNNNSHQNCLDIGRSGRNIALPDIHQSHHNDLLGHTQVQRVLRNATPVTPFEAVTNGFDAESATVRSTSSLHIESTTVFGHPDGEDRENCGGSGTAVSSPLETNDNVSVDYEDSGRPHAAGIGLPANTEDLPLASRASEAIFTEIQLELESLLLELRSFEEDVRDSLSVTGSASSENLEAEEPFDGHGNGSGSRQSSGETPRSTGAGDQDHRGSGRKRL